DETAGRETDLERINTILEESLDRYMAQLPTSAEIVQKWQETKTKLPHQPDGKWKFKLKLPFVFGEIEKELSWDSMAALKMIRRELGAFRKGEKTLQQLFVEDDDD
ncbi:MAG: hypothetical protein KDD15_25810, partial [Lewinella sp.]|nr:hypothetical protein [Lewinella sp.]